MAHTLETQQKFSMEILMYSSAPTATTTTTTTTSTTSTPLHHIL